MSPEDSNNPGLNTKPDLSAVPLPEPAQAQPPYAPPSGTLGDIAENVSDDTADQQPTAIPTPGIIAEDSNSPNGASASQLAPETSPAGAKPNNKKLPLIIGLAVLAAAIVGAVLFIVANPFGGGNDGQGNGASSDSPFTSDRFFVSSDEKGATTYAIYDSEGKAVTGFVFSAAPDYFVANAALVRKGKEYGLIDPDGKEIIPFGQYGKITAYGALYGLTRDGEQILVNNKGEKVIEYTDSNLGQYSNYTAGKPVAYTVFRKDNHYTIYGPYGNKATEFDSESTPTISTPSFGQNGAQTIIVYSGGIIILDDKGGEISKFERNITKRYYGVFISKNSKLIGLSTTNEPVVETLGSITVPNDKRDNALIYNGTFYAYDSKDCAGLYYDDTYASDDETGYVLCMKGYSGYPISLAGEIAPNTYSPDLSRTSPHKLYLVDSIFPIGIDSYGIMTDGDSFDGTYGVFYNGKRVANFVSGNTTYDSDSDKFTKTDTTIHFDFYGMADGYIVNRIESKTISQYTNSSFTGTAKKKYSASGKIIFYNKKGEEICTFDKDGYYGVAERSNSLMPELKDVSRIDISSVTGFTNGVAQVKKVGGDGFVNINTKCEIEDENAVYERAETAGDVVITTKKTKNGYKQELRDKQNKVIATANSDDPSPTIASYANSYRVFIGKDKKYFLIGDKIAKEFDHFCFMGSGVNFTEGRYVELITAGSSAACEDAGSVSGEHYYFLPNGKQFYYWKEGDDSGSR